MNSLVSMIFIGSESILFLMSLLDGLEFLFMLWLIFVLCIVIYVIFFIVVFFLVIFGWKFIYMGLWWFIFLFFVIFGIRSRNMDYYDFM